MVLDLAILGTLPLLLVKPIQESAQQEWDHMQHLSDITAPEPTATVATSPSSTTTLLTDKLA